MKLSNKILLGFFSAIFIYTLLAAGEIRFTGIHNSDRVKSIKSESLSLTKYKYLIINDIDINVSIQNSQESKIVLKSNDGNLIENVQYKLSSDSLIIYSIELNTRNRVNLDIYIPNSVTHINSKANQVQLKEFRNDSLFVVQSGGIFNFNKDAEMKYLNLIGTKKSNFRLNSLTVQTLDLDMDNSRVIIQKQVDKIKGILKNTAELNSNGFNELDLNKGENCRVFIR